MIRRITVVCSRMFRVKTDLLLMEGVSLKESCCELGGKLCGRLLTSRIGPWIRDCSSVAMAGPHLRGCLRKSLLPRCSQPGTWRGPGLRLRAGSLCPTAKTPLQGMSSFTWLITYWGGFQLRHLLKSESKGKGCDAGRHHEGRPAPVPLTAAPRMSAVSSGWCKVQTLPLELLLICE